MTIAPPCIPSSDEMGLFVSDHVTAMLAYWDKDLVCRFVNNAYLEWFGKTKEELIDRATMKELLGPLFEKNLPYIKGVLAGKKQLFEREITLADGSIRQSLATYIPDIADGEVKGFFVHVADITYTKELEAKLLHSKQEMLRNVIEAQEREKMSIEHILNENVSQMLVYSKMLLSHGKAKTDDTLNAKILDSINHAINELKALSFNLTPTAIKHFGFISGTEDYLEHLKTEHPVRLFFEYSDNKIETLELEDKLSVFRIIQNFILILIRDSMARNIGIRLNYTGANLIIHVSHNDINFQLSKTSKEFMDIEQRLEYYGGKIAELKTADEIVLEIELDIDNLIKIYRR